MKKSKVAGAFEPVFGDFVEVNFLWENSAKPPLCRSEWSARYFLRCHFQKLVEAKAIARVGGRTFVHPTRIERVFESVAISNVGGDAHEAVA